MEAIADRKHELVVPSADDDNLTPHKCMHPNCASEAGHELITLTIHKECLLNWVEQDTPNEETTTGASILHSRIPGIIR